jgi:DNA-binding PadR family transcriptional regulator
MSGYDVHKLFATTPMAHFSSSPGAIYPALRRLERRGLLKAKLEGKSEARPRRVYTLTREGGAVLSAWLRQQVTREELIRNSGAPILRFALSGSRVSQAEAISYLEGWRQEIESYLPELRGYLDSAGPESALHGQLSLQRGIRGYEEDAAWTADAIAQIQGRARGTNARGRRRSS